MVDGDGLDDEPLLVRVAVERRGDSPARRLRGHGSPDPRADQLPDRLDRVRRLLRRDGDPRSRHRAEPRQLPARSRSIAPYGSVLNPQASRRRSSAATSSRTASRPSSWRRSARRFPSGASPPTTATRTSTSSPPPTTTGRANVQFEIEVGGWGGRRASTARTVSRPAIHNLANNPIELVENEFPLRIIRYGLRQDSGGAGRFRGGLGAERTFELLADCELSTQFDRVKFPPPGLHGGSAGRDARGSSSSATASRGASRQVARRPASARRPRHGADPGRRRARATAAERDPAALARDVASGKVTRGAHAYAPS